MYILGSAEYETGQIMGDLCVTLGREMLENQLPRGAAGVKRGSVIYQHLYRNQNLVINA
jgi:hypothetical protein